MSTWKQIRQHYKASGMKSNGLYNKVQQSSLTDTPHVGEELKEAIEAYIRHYKTTNGKRPSYLHLNHMYGLRASQTFYKGLSNE